MSDIAQELLDTVTPYWEAEAEVSKRFFEGSPTHEGHIYWLRAQIWKELHPVDGYFNGYNATVLAYGQARAPAIASAPAAVADALLRIA